MWRRKKHPDPPCPPTPERDPADEQGINEAHAALEQALSQWPDVTSVANEIRGVRLRNHLADKMQDALGSHPR